VDTSFHHAEAFDNNIRVAWASFCIIQEVLELSESVRTLTDRTHSFLTPWQDPPMADTSYESCKGYLATHL
jgi:hypothetical protein